MKARYTWWYVPGILLVAWIAPARTALAQAPPGPQTGAPPAEGGPPPPPIKPVRQAKPRQTIMGAWKLNRDESDSPRERMHENRQRGGYGGGRPGGGYPGGGRGPYGGRGGSDEDLQRMGELMEPAREIRLAMTGAEVDLFDNLDRKRAFMTDGRKLQKSKNSSYAEIAAHWEGNRLVSDEKDPLGNKMSRTFELSEDGLQLYEKVHMTVGRSGAPLAFQFVYDATDNPSSTGLR